MMRVNLDFPARPSEGIVEQISGHLVKVLLLACSRRFVRHALRNGNSFVRVNFPERIDDVGNARSDQCLRARWSTQGRGTRASEVMTDAPLHQ